jgi:tetratricopeptide (TPR) repeat protein
MLGPTEPAPLRRSRTTPPPPPPRRNAAASGPVAQPPAIPPPQPGNRATAMWATEGLKQDAPELAHAAQSGPFVGKLAAIPDEPAFAGRVRMAPSDAGSFDSSRVRELDDDDELMPARRGSRVGMWVLLIALLVMGISAAAVYMFVLRTGKDEPSAQPTRDAGAAVVAVVPDAAPVVTPVPVDVTAVEALAPGPRSELAADLEPRLRTAAQSLDGKLDAPSQALRAHLIAQLAQDLQDRAALIIGPEADNLRKEAKQLVLDAATAAQRALRTAGDDAGANLAMAEVLRLQGKPARDIKRYLDTARTRPADWVRDLALADALVLARDGKLEDARAAFAAIDQGDGKLETSGDVRARFHLALALAAQGKVADAKPLVETILAAQPEHAGARALAARLETQVARTDPLPPEDGADPGAAGSGSARPIATPRPPAPPRNPGAAPPVPPPPAPAGGESYDRLLARANAIADTSCARAMELYAKALEQKPNGVEALAGQGYCHIDAKEFASASSKFRAALAVSPRYEPALRGIAEGYQQQGRKEQAIEAYKAYLEVYPDSASAKKQLERLGGDSHPAAPAPQPPAPQPPAAPPPAPAPDPAGAGSGSG